MTHTVDSGYAGVAITVSHNKAGEIDEVTIANVAADAVIVEFRDHTYRPELRRLRGPDGRDLEGVLAFFDRVPAGKTHRHDGTTMGRIEDQAFPLSVRVVKAPD